MNACIVGGGRIAESRRCNDIPADVLHGWQPHMIRGVVSGMARKKFGLNVVSTKVAGGERVYRTHEAVECLLSGKSY
ncbi:MAG: DUF3489 domain-containing protein [Sulfuricellaceae bacterium]|nr:DUF3489 domain-containing protein [Sulfuricellaceae bacterium]